MFSDYKRDGSSPSSMRRKSPELTVVNAHFPSARFSFSSQGVLLYGKFDRTIRKWESKTRPSPPPTFLDAKGRERLRIDFAEWVMGLPEGYISEVPEVTRAQKIKALGNGVVPQQASHALQRLLSPEYKERND